MTHRPARDAPEQAYRQDQVESPLRSGEGATRWSGLSLTWIGGLRREGRRRETDQPPPPHPLRPCLRGALLPLVAQGGRRVGHGAAEAVWDMGCRALAMTRETFCPPKPKELLSTAC